MDTRISKCYILSFHRMKKLKILLCNRVMLNKKFNDLRWGYLPWMNARLIKPMINILLWRANPTWYQLEQLTSDAFWLALIRFHLEQMMSQIVQLKNINFREVAENLFLHLNAFWNSCPNCSPFLESYFSKEQSFISTTLLKLESHAFTYTDSYKILYTDFVKKQRGSRKK